MDVNRLLGDELAYELYVRGYPVGNTVAEKRVALRNALRLEGESAVTTRFDLALDSVEEKDICERKLNELEQAIINFDFRNRDNEYKRISSRLAHIAGRLDRFCCKEIDLEIERLRLVAKCTRLREEISLLLEGSVEFQRSINNEDRPVSILDTPIPQEENQPIATAVNYGGTSNELIGLEEDPDPSLRFPSNLEPQQGLCSTYCHPTQFQTAFRFSNSEIPRGQLPLAIPVQPSGGASCSNAATCGSSSGSSLPGLWPQFETITPLSCVQPTNYFCNQPRLDIVRWNVRYNGRSSVNDFLERMEEIRLSRGVGKAELLRCAPELFTDEALLWYRTGRFSSWDHLCDQLRAAFRPYDYEFGLWDEIRRRTQGGQEKVLTFITVMENLFRKLEQAVPESSRVNLIRRNLLPSIQTQLALQEIHTISELTRLARAVEETEWRTRKFVPPPTNYHNLLEPALAYRKPASSGKVSVVAAEEGEVVVISPEESSPGAEPTCWNCGQTGHRFRACSHPKRRFCFRCGRPNVMANNCPRCSKNSKPGQR